MTPLVPPGRVVGLDLARCLALVAMIATHVLSPFAPDGGASLTQTLAAGRAAALFAVLAGVSIALLSGQSSPVRGRRRVVFSVGLAVRAVLIGGLGLLLAELPTNIAVILAYYGVLFVLAIPFVGLGPRSLSVLAAVWTVVVPLLSHVVRRWLPEGDTQSPLDLTGLATELTLTGTYPAVPWLAYVFAGMAIGRCDLRRRGTAAALVGLGGALAGTAKVVSLWLVGTPPATQALMRSTGVPDEGTLAIVLERGRFGTTPTDTWWWMAVSSPHSTTPLDLAHTIGTSLFLVGVALLVADLAPRTTAAVFGAGAMTLTLYSLHVVLRTPGLLAGDSVTTYLAHVAIVLAIGALYRLARRSGPLERLVSRLSGLAASRVVEARARAGLP